MVEGGSRSGKEEDRGDGGDDLEDEDIDGGGARDRVDEGVFIAGRDGDAIGEGHPSGRQQSGPPEIIPHGISLT